MSFTVIRENKILAKISEFTVSSEAKCLVFDLNLHVLPYMYVVSSEGSHANMHICSLV